MKTEYRINPSEAWLRNMADAEAECPSIAVGGLAHDLGFMATPEPMKLTFARFLEFARRSRKLTLEQFAEKADVPLAELLELEQGVRGVAPIPRTIYKLATTLGYPIEKLMELSGLIERRDETLDAAALRFAARSEPNAALTPEERDAFEELVKVLVGGSDGGK